MTTIRFSDLPTLHAPLDGGTFQGLMTDRDGRHLAVVLLPDRGACLTWDQAVEWAESVGGVLPTRPISAMLYDCSVRRLRGWCWCAESHDADGSYAWTQGFSDGGAQFDTRKSYEGRAIAVRFIEVVA